MTENQCNIGIDIGGTKIEAAIVNSRGEIEHSLFCETRVEEGYQVVLANCVKLVRSLQNDSKVSLKSVGVGVAAQVSKAGKVQSSPNLKWQDVPFQDDLHGQLKLPVVVINDVYAATWGEWKHGAGRGCDHFACVFVGTGVGGGLVCNGHLLEGCSNNAGEIGHMTIDINGMLCTCGNRGCLETFAGGWAIASRAQEVMDLDPTKKIAWKNMMNGNSKITAKEVFEAAKGLDPAALKIIENAIAGLIAGSISIVNAFNPSRLILGGSIIYHNPTMVALIEKGVREKALKTATKPLEILMSDLKNNAGVIGAASYAGSLAMSSSPVVRQAQY